MVLKNSNFRDQWKYGTSDGSQPQAGLCSRHTVTKRSMEKYVGISLEYRQRFTLGNAPQETYRLKREGTVSMSLTACIIHWTAWGKNKQRNKTCSMPFPKHAGIVFSHSIQSPKDLAFLFITGVLPQLMVQIFPFLVHLQPQLNVNPC